MDLGLVWIGLFDLIAIDLCFVRLFKKLMIIFKTFFHKFSIKKTHSIYKNN